jgi:hypothetical protein
LCGFQPSYLRERRKRGMSHGAGSVLADQINTSPTQAASGQVSRRLAGRDKARRPARGQARVSGEARRPRRDPRLPVIELDYGVLVYPPEEADQPMRAVFTENGGGDSGRVRPRRSWPPGALAACAAVNATVMASRDVTA